MSENPLTLSIVIPAFNEERYIGACLDAIAKQTVKPDEVIVVDNNSTDRTAEIARAYKFVKVLREEKQGRVFARNRGFDAVTGDIIGRIDADTILPPNWAERIRRFYEDKEHLMHHAYTGGATCYNLRMARLNSWFQEQIAYRTNRFLLGHYILFGSNMALPAAFWRAVRSSVCLRNDIHEDLDLSIHLHRMGYKVTYHAGHDVGIQLRRVRSHRQEFMANLMLWPMTLRVHHNKRWVFGWLGAKFLYYASYELIFNEWLSQRFGKKPLPE